LTEAVKKGEGHGKPGINLVRPAHPRDQALASIQACRQHAKPPQPGNAAAAPQPDKFFSLIAAVFLLPATLNLQDFELMNIGAYRCRK